MLVDSLTFFLSLQRHLTEFMMMEEEEEEEDTHMADLSWLMMLMTFGTATNAPYAYQHFQSRATSTDLWDRIVMKTWDDQQWNQNLCMKKPTFLEHCVPSVYLYPF